jgi:hypothetical protein
VGIVRRQSQIAGPYFVLAHERADQAINGLVKRVK